MSIRRKSKNKYKKTGGDTPEPKREDMPPVLP